MIQYRYILDKKSKKHKCPDCGMMTFTYYINSDTGEVFNQSYGRCDREDNCKYHKHPKESPDYNITKKEGFHSTSIGIQGNGNLETKKKLSYIPIDLLMKSVAAHTKSDIYPFLCKIFDDTIASVLCHRYYIGANKEGHTVFFQVDVHGNVRQVRVMMYNSDTGRRNKEAPPYFMGRKLLKDQDPNLRQCLFGEHLLAEPAGKDRFVAIVESEKTAIIASIYFPDYIWIATGGATGARWNDPETASVLTGRTVVLFPDLGVHDKWKEKGIVLEKQVGCKVITIDLLEKVATAEQRQNGLDLADFLLQNSDSSGKALVDTRGLEVPNSSGITGYPIVFDYYSRNPYLATPQSHFLPAESPRNLQHFIDCYTNIIESGAPNMNDQIKELEGRLGEAGFFLDKFYNLFIK